MRKLQMKKFIAILGCVSLLAGCGSQTTTTDTMNTETIQGTVSTDTNSETTVIENSNEEVKETEKIDETKESEVEIVIDRTETFALLSDMGMGWNLGNTFDAHGSKHSLADETYWGNPKTTKEMLHAVREQGFKTIRIPITFADHVGAAPDYTIDADWLDRCQEVIDWAMEEGFYVIIDTHHEPDYWLKPTTDQLDAVTEELVAIWAQVAERFKDYDNHLLFEGMNEPRMKGTAEEWSGGTKEGRACVNALNKAFVETVRNSGGNNETRVCIICTYGNSVSYNTVTELEIPKDNYIMVAVHLYTPYFFTYHVDGDQNISVWDGSKKSDIISNMQLLDKNWISKDVPVIITEMGCVHDYITDNSGNRISNTEEVIKWLNDYMETVNKYGLKAIWWDNGIYKQNGEQFGIFDRNNLTWFTPEVVNTMIELAE